MDKHELAATIGNRNMEDIIRSEADNGNLRDKRRV